MIKQVIVIRKDLKMRRGKEIAQGSHASMAFLLERDTPNHLLNGWLNNAQTKVCVSVNSQEELEEANNKICESGINNPLPLLTLLPPEELDEDPIVSICFPCSSFKTSLCSFGDNADVSEFNSRLLSFTEHPIKKLNKPKTKQLLK